MAFKRTKKFAGGGFLIPAQVRTFAQTVMGKRDPITEKDFSPEELKQIRDAIVKSRARQKPVVEMLENDPEYVDRWRTSPEERKKGIMKDVLVADKQFKKTGSYYDPTVDYRDYDSDRTTSSYGDFNPLPSAAARNTLGRFRYEKTPEGRLVAIDSYDFKDDLVDRRPGVPRSEEYKKLSTLEKIGKLASDSFKNETGGIGTLPSRVGSAFVGKVSRPVRVDLGEAPFKKGGKVSSNKPIRSKSSKRGDGIAKKGFTKGRYI